MGHAAPAFEDKKIISFNSLNGGTRGLFGRHFTSHVMTSPAPEFLLMILATPTD